MTLPKVAIKLTVVTLSDFLPDRLKVQCKWSTNKLTYIHYTHFHCLRRSHNSSQFVLHNSKHAGTHWQKHRECHTDLTPWGSRKANQCLAHEPAWWGWLLWTLRNSALLQVILNTHTVTCQLRIKRWEKTEPWTWEEHDNRGGGELCKRFCSNVQWHTRGVMVKYMWSWIWLIV